MVKILLVKQLPDSAKDPSSNACSVEAGYHDGVRHFDHHGEFESNPAVTLQDIKPQACDVIYVTHIDADTLLGIAKLLGKPFKVDLDWNVVGEVDTHGPEYVPDTPEGKRARAFMLGVTTLTRTLSIPRPSDTPTDITDQVMSILNTDPESIIRAGALTMQEGEQLAKESLVESQDGVAVLNIPPTAKSGADVTQLYRQGNHTVVVYNGKFKSISIYASNKLAPAPIEDYRQTWGGIPFAGHPHACGSPRGQSFTLDDALRVAKSIREYLRNSANKEETETETETIGNLNEEE